MWPSDSNPWRTKCVSRIRKFYWKRERHKAIEPCLTCSEHLVCLFMSHTWPALLLWPRGYVCSGPFCNIDVMMLTQLVYECFRHLFLPVACCSTSLPGNGLPPILSPGSESLFVLPFPCFPSLLNTLNLFFACSYQGCTISISFVAKHRQATPSCF